ncbi:hypothetical protein LSTR_LSTR013226 [Laodelphax striatellus]|uniref:AB hydrolase-1 domain-containing protein n=1 Tax=Laodelphax striatellus TaxID=195883 RepID=A0A482X9W7_LAOST|nr:hypothetical protein LSTR_LSTR013226 [Laodelphax striatellus]
MERSYEDIDIPVPWGHISGKWWGPKDRQPILVLHGWQDNAASFDRLAPLLPHHISLLCIDMIGHGRSSHFPKGNMYYFFWDAVVMVRRIVKHFDWQKVSILGHSRGGSIGYMYTAFYPHEVELLISLDIAYPKWEPTEKLVEETGKAVDKFLMYEQMSEDITRIPCYGYQEMIDLVESAYNESITNDSARILMNRGMKPASKKPGKFTFTRDVRLKVGSTLAMIPKELSRAMAERINCAYLNIRASEGFYTPDLFYDEILEIISKNARYFEKHTVSGKHHTHLNDPSEMAEIISKFLLNNENKQNEIFDQNQQEKKPCLI